MKKFIFGVVLSLFASGAAAQWQVPNNAIPFGRGSGTGFNSAAAAANSVLATNASSVPGLTTTLPTAVQDNITRLGTIVAGLFPTSLLSGRITYAQLPQATGLAIMARAASGAGNYSETACATANFVPKVDSGAAAISCGLLTNSNLDAAAAIAFSKLASLSANQVLGALTATTPSGLSLPSCSGAHNALNWTSGSGFGCGTFPSATATADRYLKGNGTTWGTSSGSASGTGACGGGQFVTGLNSDAAPTCATPAGGGDVVGPGSATDNAAARFDGTTGKLIQNSALIIDDTTGRISKSGGGGIEQQGVSTNSNASAGDIGETMEDEKLAAAFVSFAASNTPINIVTISPTAGQWQICGQVTFDVSQTATVTSVAASISSTSATMATPPGKGSYAQVTDAATVNPGFPVGCRFAKLSGTTQFWLVANSTYTAGAGQNRAYGYIWAVRQR